MVFSVKQFDRNVPAVVRNSLQLVVGFVSAGLLTLTQSVGVIFGANVGTTVTAQIVAFNTTALAFPFIAIGFVMTSVWKQGVTRHYGAMLMGLGLLFYGNVMGAVIWLPFIPQLAAIAQSVSPIADHLQGVERLAEEVPRQIANAATIWATANTMIFLPFAAWFATLAIRLIPDRAVAQKELIRPRYLDDELIRVPSLALERARMELGHMSELTNSMLAEVKSAFVARDLQASRTRARTENAPAPCARSPY